MARIIEFYVPAKFQRREPLIARSQKGKVIVFCAEAKKPTQPSRSKFCATEKLRVEYHNDRRKIHRDCSHAHGRLTPHRVNIPAAAGMANHVISSGISCVGTSLSSASSVFNINYRTLLSQIENPAHRLDDRGRLIGCSSVQQHCHRRLEHLFYDATTKRFHNVLLLRAQIAQASAHAMNFTAAHGLKTLS